MAIATAKAGHGAFQSEAPIDLVRLAANTLGDRALEVQILRLFVTQSRTVLERLASHGGVGQQKDLVHTLKGSARGVGAEAVASCCERLESRLQAGEALDFSGLHRTVAETNTYIADLLSE